MSNTKYIHLSADTVAHIKQRYYDEIGNINNLINDSERQSSILKVSIIDIDEELKNIKLAIKNTIFLIKELVNNIELKEDTINGLEKMANSNFYNNFNKTTILRYKIAELEKMKSNLMMLEERKRFLINRKKELISNKRDAKKNIRTIDKNLKIYNDNIVLLHLSLIEVDNAAIYSDGYIKEKALKPKTKGIIKLK